MKNICIILLALTITSVCFAQSNERTNTSSSPERGGYRRDNIFIGGGVGLGYSGDFYGSNFNVGLTPEIGYSLSEIVDVGVSLNLNYYVYSLGDNSGYRQKQKSFNYGGGVFARIYPINQFFIQLLPEHNWVDTRISDNAGSPSYKIHQQSNSFLAGIGYGTRNIGESGFYTILMIDVNKDPGSPYRDGYGNIIPIVRVGFNLYLRPKKR